MMMLDPFFLPAAHFHGDELLVREVGEERRRRRSGSSRGIRGLIDAQEIPFYSFFAHLKTVQCDERLFGTRHSCLPLK